MTRVGAVALVGVGWSAGAVFQRLASTVGELCAVWDTDRRPGRHL